MDDTENRISDAIAAGKKNLMATTLLRNWCLHAELARSPGRGMVEAATGLPIGHTGVQCKFSKNNSMHTWLLEDAVYDFYLSNCKECKEQVPVGTPNIMDFVAPREEAAVQRKLQREKEAEKRQQEKALRVQERAELRNALSLEETYVLDLVDELDQEDLKANDPRLEQLANLAPETFTRKVIEHLLPAATKKHLPYSTATAKALLGTPLTADEKLAVAVRLVMSFVTSPEAVEYVLSEAHRLSLDSLSKVSRRFVSMALPPPPGMHIGGSEPRTYDATPIKALFEKRQADVCREVETLLGSTEAEKIETAVEIILATECKELLETHSTSVFAKLMRRRTLLPKERRDSGTLYYLREAASKYFEHSPEEVDKIIQSFLKDDDEIGRKEALRIYQSVLKHGYRKQLKIGAAQRIAFKRMLWAAVERPDAGLDDAGQFFRHAWDELAQLAVEHMDDLIGAAATLSEKYEQVDEERLIELSDDVLAHVDRRNKRSSIDSLQGALIQWAAVGAKSKGKEGIEDFLGLYQRLPAGQVQMRGNMIVHVSRLLSGVESLNLVLSDWYRALMDESVLVRTSAVQAWEDVPYDLQQNFPDLFYEAFVVLLSDPYIAVHQSAVRALRQRFFPKEKRPLLSAALWNLILSYAQDSKHQEFVVECIDVFAFLCITSEQRKGRVGEILTGILLSLEGGALYNAVDRLVYRFQDVPGFAKVALKSIRDEYTRSISVDDCITTIMRANPGELRKCMEDIETSFDNLKPFKPEEFAEALLLISALTRTGNYLTAQRCSKELLGAIPEDKRNAQWRLKAELVVCASEIEAAINQSETTSDMQEKWDRLNADLEIENEERSKFRDFPPRFLSED